MKKGRDKRKEKRQKSTGLSTNWKTVCVVAGLIIGLLITGINRMPSREFRKAVESLPEVQGFLVMYPDAALSGRERVAGNLWKVEGTDGIHNVTVFLDENNQPAYILETWKCGDKVCEESENCSTCPVDCNTHHEYRDCVGDTIYWFDSCGNPEDLIWLCSSNQECISGHCVFKCGNGICESDENCGNCRADCSESHAERRCVGNSLYWFSNCDIQEELIESCPSYGQCVSGQCECPPYGCDDPYWTEGDPLKEETASGSAVSSAYGICPTYNCSGPYYYELLPEITSHCLYVLIGIDRTLCKVECVSDKECPLKRFDDYLVHQRCGYDYKCKINRNEAIDEAIRQLIIKSHEEGISVTAEISRLHRAKEAYQEEYTDFPGR